jgi:hypothetical protein
MSHSATVACRVVFDIGGVLRARKATDLSESEKRRCYRAIRHLYKLLAEDPYCEVVIVTWKPRDQATHAFVENELRELHLPQPDSICIVTANEQKGPIYEELQPDLIFEDEDKWIDQATWMNLTTLKVD